MESAAQPGYDWSMSKPAPLFDAEDWDAEERALQTAEADLAAGRVVDHDDVVRWLESWGTPDEKPRPQCK
mgnify:CR=1 FL=1